MTALPTHVLYWIPAAGSKGATGWWDLQPLSAWVAAGPLSRDWQMAAPLNPDAAALASWVSERIGRPVVLARSRIRIRYFSPSWPFRHTRREAVFYVTPVEDDEAGRLDALERRNAALGFDIFGGPLPGTAVTS